MPVKDIVIGLCEMPIIICAGIGKKYGVSFLLLNIIFQIDMTRLELH
jgi:hypothetical protein